MTGHPAGLVCIFVKSVDYAASVGGLAFVHKDV